MLTPSLPFGAVAVHLQVVFNLRLRGKVVRLPERIWSVVVVIFGATGAGIAIYQAILALIGDLKKH